MKFVTLLLSAILTFPSFANSYNEGVRRFEIKKEKRSTHVSHPRHLHQGIFHGEKTSYAVVVVHGNFESPVRTKSITEFFGHDLGFNTLNILLPGYFDAPMEKLDQTKYEEWVREVYENIKIAKELGQKIIVFGHSLGGLLAIYAGYEFSRDVDMVIASAPAFKQKLRVRLGGIFGSWLGISGNDYLNQPQDGGFEVPYLSPRTSKQVNDLSKELIRRHGVTEYYYDSDGNRKSEKKLNYKSYKVPTMVIASKKDEVLNHKKMLEFYEGIKVRKYLKLYNDLQHDAINKDEQDNILFNPNFDKLVQEIADFVKA